MSQTTDEDHRTSARHRRAENLWLDRLRDHFPMQEMPLVGFDQIAAWLTGMGWTLHDGRPVTPARVASWRRLRGLPIASTPDRRPWTTSFLMAIWCLSEPLRRRSIRHLDPNALVVTTRESGDRTGRRRR